MTKKQFLEELKTSLEGMVSPMVVQQNMNYYETISFGELQISIDPEISE